MYFGCLDLSLGARAGPRTGTRTGTGTGIGTRTRTGTRTATGTRTRTAARTTYCGNIGANIRLKSCWDNPVDRIPKDSIGF